MATINVELRNYLKKDGTQPLEIRIRENNKMATKNIGISIRADQWDAARQKVKRNHPDYDDYNQIIAARIEEVSKARLEALKLSPIVAPKKIINAVLGSTSLLDGLKALKAKKEDRRGRLFQNVIDTIEHYDSKITLQEVDSDWLESFRGWLKKGSDYKKALKHNTVVNYMKTISDVYNSLKIPIRSPFDDILVGSYRPSADVPLTIEEIKKLLQYVPRNSIERIAKDTWLFSFFTSGLRSADVLTLKWSSIRGDRLIIEPGKTEDTTAVVLSIPITSQALEILSRYKKSTATVFDVLPPDPTYKQIESVQADLNRAHKAIALHAGLPPHFKMKLARTTFAHYAQKSTNDIYSTQGALGHGKVATTEIYLAGFVRETDDSTNAVASLFK